MKSTAIRSLKRALRPLKTAISTAAMNHRIHTRAKNGGAFGNNFNYSPTKERVLNFLSSMNYGHDRHQYRYSASCSKPTLYASAYACMTLSLYEELNKLSESEKSSWIAYFDSFQREDGLFYDSAVDNHIYNDTDWWGARHITMHMISAYTDLGARPKQPFAAIRQHYQLGNLSDWINSEDWSSPSLGQGDIDNKIMNIGCMLQYQRDAWHDEMAASALTELKDALRSKINPTTGMWCEFDTEDPNQRSRMIQFAYHLFLLFFYDNEFDFDIDKIVDHTLNTQNKYGGFGVKPNSSACEDIDSIDILIRLYDLCSQSTKDRIDSSLEASLRWVLINQVSDGGFVFRLNEPFMYGSIETSSQANQGAMLPTWFRSLSLAYLTSHLRNNHNYVITNAPGCEFI